MLGKARWLLLALVLGGCTERPTQFERTSTNAVAHGERLARVLGCVGCHGEGLTGEDWSEPGFGRLWTSNLTIAAAQLSEEDLERTIRSGARPDSSALWEMPSHLFTQLSEPDMRAIIAYLRSQRATGEARPLPVLEDGARRAIEAGAFMSSREHVTEQGDAWPPDLGDEHQLGRYIVRSTCAECHGMTLAGGQPFPGAALRPDLRMVAGYERDDFMRLMRSGVAVGERELELMSDVARTRYSYFTETEVDAVYRYLQALGATQ